MKYIKTYEHMTEEEVTKLRRICKKYVVYDFKDEQSNITIAFYVDEIEEINIERSTINAKPIYQYDEEYQKFNPVADRLAPTYKFKEYLDFVLFTSDDLEECRKFLILYVEKTKYNI